MARIRSNHSRTTASGIALMLVLMMLAIGVILSAGFLQAQGLSLSMARNLQRQTQARALAESGLEMALGYLRGQPNWRSLVTPGVWCRNMAWGGGTITIRGEDGRDSNADGVVEGDGDLANNPSNELTLTATAQIEGVSHSVRAVARFVPLTKPRMVLFVVNNPNSLTAAQKSQDDLLASWGWDTLLVDDDASQSQFNVAADGADVALIGNDVGGLSTKLRTTPMGVVNGDAHQSASWGLSASGSSYLASDSDRVYVLNNTHPITTGVNAGWLTTGTPNINTECLSGGLATGLVQLAKRTTTSTVVLGAVETGGVLQNGGVATGRRVAYPFADYSAKQLTIEGQKLLQQSLEWAAASMASNAAGFSSILPSSRRKMPYNQIATRIVMPEAGTATRITAYVKCKVSRAIRYALYRDANGEPGTLIAQTGVMTLPSNRWTWLPGPIPPAGLTPGAYWLALAFDHNNQWYRYNGLGQSRVKARDATGSGFLSTWGSSNSASNEQINIFLTYTPQNAAAPAAHEQNAGWAMEVAWDEQP